MMLHFKSFRSQAMRQIEMRCGRDNDVSEQGVSGSIKHWEKGDYGCMQQASNGRFEGGSCNSSVADSQNNG